jgi:hypothetical protein
VAPVAPRGCELGEARVDRSAHAVLPAVAYNVCHTQGPLKEDFRIVAGTGVDPDDVVRRPGLVRQRCQGSGEIGTAVVGNHNGSDVDILMN